MPENDIGKGYVQVYTGNCKGKTTAALGLAFRAMGHDLRTYVGQFMKGQKYGELDAARMVGPYITIEQFGGEACIPMKDPPDPEDVRRAQSGLHRSAAQMMSGNYSIVVFDEILTARHFGLVSTENILALLVKKPDGVEMILTGRYAPPEIVAAADLVTEMVEVKHYYQKGVLARAGIER